jgi:hypothetical protein
MLQLKSKITINNNIVFDFVNEVDIFSSWQNLTDKCKITVPRKLSFNGKPIVIGLNSIFQRGQPIKVELGYDDDIKTAFTGYLSKIDPRLPLVFECEDEMYQLKKNNLPNLSYASVNLSTLLKDIIPSTVTYKATLEQNLGKLRISSNATTAQILDYLRTNCGIYSFFRDRVLYIGLPYVPALRKNFTFTMEKNVIHNEMEYMRKEDVQIKVRGVSIDGENKKHEYYYPSQTSPGQQIDMHYNNLDSASLQLQTQRFYNSFKFEGWSGNFTTFGAPYVNHGDGVQFKSSVLPEYDLGIYLVKSVHRNFGMNGYKQKIEPSQRIS